MASIYDRRKPQQTGAARQFGAPAASRQQTAQPRQAQAKASYSQYGGSGSLTANQGNGESLTPQQIASAQQAGNNYGGFDGNYAGQLQDLLNQILNRPNFEYDLNADMLYQQYRDQYQRAGQQAMADTMGQAATMTGGYGNSYAASAGNQAYQQYLTQLNNIVPELYDRAYKRYNQEQSDLMNQYSLLMNAQQYEDQQNQQEATNLANAGWQLLQSGVMPSSAQLAAMQISQAQAQAIINQRGRRSGGGSAPRQQPEDTGGTDEVPVVNPPGATQDIHTNGGIGNQSTWTPNGPIINPAQNAAFQLWLAQQSYKK